NARAALQLQEAEASVLVPHAAQADVGADEGEHASVAPVAPEHPAHAHVEHAPVLRVAAGDLPVDIVQVDREHEPVVEDEDPEAASRTVLPGAGGVIEGRVAGPAAHPGHGPVAVVGAGGSQNVDAAPHTDEPSARSVFLEIPSDGRSVVMARADPGSQN